ncbi:MAG TPA: glycosyltransferase [Solirubrobacteraceae bacterium]|jgi:glycosyltransferase involved in cell wall biosynthesis|nr:glycosyltransferase [Solirubrobacteraceae bacterium]
MRIMHVNLGGFGGTVDGISAAESQLLRLLSEAGHQSFRLDRQGALSPAGAIRAVATARRMRVDVVHLHSLFRPAHCLLARTLRAWNIPYVVSPHSALAPAALRRDGFRKRLFLDLLDRSMLRGATAVICLTPREHQDVLSACPDARTAIVPNPHVFDAETRWSWCPSQRPTILTLARYDVYHKGLDYLSWIARALPEADFRVHGVPDHNEVELIGAVARTAPANYSLEPPVVGPAKAHALAGADLYIQASRWEGLSISLIEAFAVGVPTVVSAQVADTVPMRVQGLGLVMPRDPTLAAEAIRRLLDDPDRQRAMSDAGSAWVRAALAPERVIPLLEEVYLTASGLNS